MKIKSISLLLLFFMLKSPFQVEGMSYLLEDIKELYNFSTNLDYSERVLLLTNEFKDTIINKVAHTYNSNIKILKKKIERKIILKKYGKYSTKYKPKDFYIGTTDGRYFLGDTINKRKLSRFKNKKICWRGYIYGGIEDWADLNNIFNMDKGIDYYICCEEKGSFEEIDAAIQGSVSFFNAFEYLDVMRSEVKKVFMPISFIVRISKKTHYKDISTGKEYLFLGRLKSTTKKIYIFTFLDWCKFVVLDVDRIIPVEEIDKEVSKRLNKIARKKFLKLISVYSNRLIEEIEKYIEIQDSGFTNVKDFLGNVKPNHIIYNICFKALKQASDKNTKRRIKLYKEAQNYINTKNYMKAITNLIKAKKLKEKILPESINPTENEINNKISRAYYLYGEQYYNNKEYNKAIKYFKLSLEYADNDNARDKIKKIKNEIKRKKIWSFFLLEGIYSNFIPQNYKFEKWEGDCSLGGFELSFMFHHIGIGIYWKLLVSSSSEEIKILMNSNEYKIKNIEQWGVPIYINFPLFNFFSIYLSTAYESTSFIIYNENDSEKNTFKNDNLVISGGVMINIYYGKRGIISSLEYKQSYMGKWLNSREVAISIGLAFSL